MPFWVLAIFALSILYFGQSWGLGGRELMLCEDYCVWVEGLGILGKVFKFFLSEATGRGGNIH